MDSIKVVVGLASILIIALLGLMACIENPETALYEETIKTMMIHEDMASSKDVTDHFPELGKVKAKMDRIAYLKSKIHSMTAGPSPNLSQDEGSHMHDWTLEIRKLQKSVREELQEFRTSYAAY